MYSSLPASYLCPEVSTSRPDPLLFALDHTDVPLLLELFDAVRPQDVVHGHPREVLLGLEVLGIPQDDVELPLLLGQGEELGLCGGHGERHRVELPGRAPARSVMDTHGQHHHVLEEGEG